MHSETKAPFATWIPEPAVRLGLECGWVPTGRVGLGSRARDLRPPIRSAWGDRGRGGLGWA